MRDILAYSFTVTTPVSFVRTGKAEVENHDWMHPVSRLEDFELIIVTRSTLYLQFGNIKYSISEGEYLLLHPQQNLQESEISNIRKGFQKSQCSFFWLHFGCRNAAPRNALRQDLINDGRDTILIPVHGKLKSPQKALLLLVRLQDSIRNHYSPLYLDLLSTLVLCEISAQNEQRSTRMSGPDSGTQKFLNEIKDYISFRIKDDIKVSDIASRFGYNEKYLSRLFRKDTGLSLKQYIIHQKIENANFLLMDSNLSVKEIADYLGFQSYHTFEQMYKKYTSMTPTGYREVFHGRITNYEKSD